ncbi:MAG: hypothetical protein IRZ21_03255 [Thermoleophilaceae bacterium]|nr:hypothetical protein [Thermoleophilaceae bacterium]
MTGAERWRDNWLAVSPTGAAPVRLGRGRAAGRTLARTVRALPPGAPVVLLASAPGALRRSQAFARAAELELEREYLALPSAAAPAYLVEDAPASVAAFLGSVLAPPPRAGLPGMLVGAGIAVLRRLGSRRLVRALCPGRISVGRRR